MANLDSPPLTTFKSAAVVGRSLNLYQKSQNRNWKGYARGPAKFKIFEIAAIFLIL